jgi:hypothetical protein
MRNKILAGILLTGIALSLTGCYDNTPGRYSTLKERIDYRNKCEEAGGVYSETWWLGEFRDSDCKLTEQE